MFPNPVWKQFCWLDGVNIFLDRRILVVWGHPLLCFYACNPVLVWYCDYVCMRIAFLLGFMWWELWKWPVLCKETSCWNRVLLEPNSCLIHIQLQGPDVPSLWHVPVGNSPDNQPGAAGASGRSKMIYRELGGGRAHFTNSFLTCPSSLVFWCSVLLLFQLNLFHLKIFPIEI